MNPLASAVIAAIVTGVATPIVRGVLVRLDVLDVPNERSSHVTVVPRGGGIAVAIGTLVAVTAWGWTTEVACLATAALVLGVVGFIDDHRGLPPVFRLAAQLVVPIVVTPALLRATDLGNGPMVAVGLLIAMWCAAYVNAFNFMDGINGLAVGQTLVAGCALAWLAHAEGASTLVALSLAVVGAAIGFGPFNVVNASIFLGDVGSYFLGTWLALLLVLIVAAGTPLIVALGPFVLYLLDTGTTLVKRSQRRVRLLDAHREHAYQRLVETGWTHLQVAALATGVMVVNSGVLIAANGQDWWWQVVAMSVALLAAGAFVALPTALTSKQGPSLA